MDESIFLARPTKAQLAWQDMELGLFIHWFPTGWYHEIDENRLQDHSYQKELLARVTCEELDTDQWAQSALDMGAKYIVFVAKHGLGLCLWQSDVGDFNMKNAPYRNGQGDPVAMLAASCRKYGLKLGLYLQASTFTHGAATGGLLPTREEQKTYNQIYRAWLTELLSRYGEVVEVWFDGSLQIEVGDILQKYAPDAMVFQSKYATIRWVGQEQGYASDPAWNSVKRYDALSGVATQRHGNPDGECWMPLECDARIRADWGWHDDLASNPLKSVDELMDMYYHSVGHGAVLLLNQAPNPAGRIIDEDMARMKEFGDEIRRRFGQPLAVTQGEGTELNLNLDAAQLVDHIVLMEDIRYGERIRAYVVEGFDGHKWRRLCAGSAIGHKKIDYFPAQTVCSLRLRVLHHVGVPKVRSMAAHYVGTIPQKRSDAIHAAHVIGGWGTEMYDLNTFTAHFSYQIAPYVDDAGQYRVQFVPDSASRTPLTLEDAWVEIDGVRMPDYVRPGQEPLTYEVYMGGTGRDITFHAVSRYTKTPFLRGEAIIQRME
ncbi:MAG: alpha-L-fucosidase [Christensenellales bacterium]|jgi:alpha-L-fucosidase